MRDRRVRKVKASSAGALFSDVNRDIRALNSSILIISQKMKYLVRNEKILGRNLLVLNKKLKSLEEGGMPGRGAEGIPANLTNELNALSDAISRNNEAVEELKLSIDEIKNNYAKAESLKELKFVVDSINPLDFITAKEVKELIDERIGKKKR